MLIWRGAGIVVFPIAFFGIGFARHLAHDQQLPWLGFVVVLAASALTARIGFTLIHTRLAPAVEETQEECPTSREYSAAPEPASPPPTTPRRPTPWKRGRPKLPRAPWERGRASGRKRTPHGTRREDAPATDHDFFFIPVVFWSPIILLIGSFVVFTKVAA